LEFPDRAWQVGIVGTFDVENYGDLLFPLIAEAELRARLGNVRLHAFSYHAKAPPEWPYAVTSVSDLPRVMPSLDALLIGGGFIIRFDPDVAPGYAPPDPSIHHPTGYWLIPALMAIDAHVPVLWNAPGMHLNPVPEWAGPLMELLLRRSTYVAVRDEPSRAELSRFGDAQRILVQPDTGFGLAALLPSRRSDALERLRTRAGITRPYILVHATGAVRDPVRALQHHRHLLGGYDVVSLPVGPVLLDRADLFDDLYPGVLHLPSWPDPLLLAELISESAAVIGGSYHLAITAIVSGVPVFTTADLSAGKHTALADVERVFPAARIAAEPEWFVAQLGARTPDVSPRTAALAAHWDTIAAAVRRGRTEWRSGDASWWQSLPASMQGAHVEREQTADVIAAREQRIDDLERSTSWRMTAGLRFMMRTLRRTGTR
jgi:lipopolysaccharide transport system ATP-binding protein